MICVDLDNGDTVIVNNGEIEPDPSKRPDCVIISVSADKMVATLCTNGARQTFVVADGKVIAGTLREDGTVAADEPKA